MPVNAGARLDRLPVSSFHRRIMWLIGAGMFFDGFDIYLAGIVLGATVKSGFSTLGQNAQFVSATFVGMMLGSLVTGFLGDRYGRRFTYQSNLAIFGFASLAAAFAPSMRALILIQFVIGFGLGAERNASSRHARAIRADARRDSTVHVRWWPEFARDRRL